MIGERICRINVIYQVTIYANPALLEGLGGIPRWRLPNNLRAGSARAGNLDVAQDSELFALES